MDLDNPVIVIKDDSPSLNIESLIKATKVSEIEGIKDIKDTRVLQGLQNFLDAKSQNQLIPVLDKNDNSINMGAKVTVACRVTAITHIDSGFTLTLETVEDSHTGKVSFEVNSRQVVKK